MPLTRPIIMFIGITKEMKTKTSDPMASSLITPLRAWMVTTKRLADANKNNREFTDRSSGTNGRNPIDVKKAGSAYFTFSPRRTI
jgi:hypothetical protein